MNRNNNTNHNNKTNRNNNTNRNHQFINPEVIRALTPITLASIGAFIGVAALLSNVDADKLTAAIGLSGTAIAGASGLAQSTNNKYSSEQSEDE